MNSSVTCRCRVEAHARRHSPAFGLVLAFAALAFPSNAVAHDPVTGRASAILNEGVIAEAGDTKVMFDPIYDDGFGEYPQMDEALKQKIITGQAPYDNVDAIFISHFHADHFSAGNMVRLLAAQPGVRLFAPVAAVDALRSVPEWNDRLSVQITPVALELAGPPARYELGGFTVEAVRVPHTGYPERHQAVENLVFRVTLAQDVRVLHLGDADSVDSHFAPHRPFFRSVRTGLAFVPFWILTDEGSEAFIDDTLNAEHAIGIHLPIVVPENLKQSSMPYFSALGQAVPIPPASCATDQTEPSTSEDTKNGRH